MQYGDWKEGDTTHELGYSEVEYGMCQKVVRSGKPPRNLTAVFIKAMDTFVWDPSLAFAPALHTPDTWEWVLHTDQFKKLVYFSGVLAFHSNQNPTDEPLLLATKRAMDTMVGVVHPQGPEFFRTADWRSAGVMYGMHTRFLKQHDQLDTPEFYRSEWLMWWTWKQYVLLTADSEIARLVDSGGNPYLGVPLHWLDASGEHYGRPMGLARLAVEHSIHVEAVEQPEPVVGTKTKEEEVLFVGEGEPQDELS